MIPPVEIFARDDALMAISELSPDDKVLLERCAFQLARLGQVYGVNTVLLATVWVSTEMKRAKDEPSH